MVILADSNFRAGLVNFARLYEGNLESNWMVFYIDRNHFEKPA